MKSVKALPRLLGLSFCAAVVVASTPALAEQGSCDSRDSADGWGVWCGVEDYLVKLTEQSPPAAGAPASGAGAPPQVVVDVGDSDPFGGDPVTPDEIVRPIDLPNGDEVYYRAAYSNRVSGESDSQVKTPAGIGTMDLVLVDSFSRRNAGDRVSGADFDMDRQQIDTFSFGESAEGHQYIAVSRDTDPRYQGKFSTVSRIGPGGSAAPHYLVNELMDGREQRILPGGELWSNASPPPGAYQVLKDYWLGTRVRSTLDLDRETGFTGLESTNSFVGGRLTPLADVQNLVAGNVIADYRGGSQHLGQVVQVRVDFGAQTFNGSWTGGQLPSNPSADPGFTASGVIQGRHMVATSFGTGVSGQLQGSFFRPGAQALGGAYAVQKVDVGGFNDTFSASKVRVGVDR